MRLNQLPPGIVNLLPETHRGFFRIHFLEITRLPSKPARHIQTITPSATGQCLPTAKLLFILTAGAHFSAGRVPRVRLFSNTHADWPAP